VSVSNILEERNREIRLLLDIESVSQEYRDKLAATNPSVAGDIQWNFTKFLVDRSGHVVRRFEPPVTPDSSQVIDSIEKLLKP